MPLQPFNSNMLYIISNILYKWLILHLNINCQGISGCRIRKKNVFDKVFAKGAYSFSGQLNGFFFSTVYFKVFIKSLHFVC